MKGFTAQLLTLNKRLAILLLLFFAFSSLSAQRHELGVKFGMSNLVGDIGRTNYFLQKPFTHKVSEHGVPFYGGLIYRMNFNPYQTVRLDLGFSHIQFDDRYAQEEYRRARKLSGTNSGAEADVVFEYNFYPVNNEQKSMLSPYVFGGIGALVYSAARVTFVNDFERNNAGVILPPNPDGTYNFTTVPEYSSASKFTMAVPFGVGLKYKFNYNWALSGELKFKPTFSDGIDYSVIDDKDIRYTYNKDVGSAKSELKQEPYITMAKERAKAILNGRTVGNTNSKDWVNSITLGLTYSFGRLPCYCD